jgi:hypothetical protein
MKAIRSSETSVNISTRCHIPEDCFLHSHAVKTSNLTYIQFFWRGSQMYHSSQMMYRKWSRSVFCLALCKVIILQLLQCTFKYKYSTLCTLLLPTTLLSLPSSS